MDRLREYIKRVRKAVRELVSDGRATEVKAEIARIGFLMGIDEALQREVEKAIRAEAKAEMERFVEERFLPASAIKEMAKDVVRLREGFDRQVFEIVRRAIVRNESDREVARRLERLGRAKQQHYYTLQNTIRIGIARQGMIERSLESGVKYFRYMGAVAGARPFCRERVGKVYSTEEIRAMDNGQGLAVEYFCGGWNCRHRWVAFSGEVVGDVALHDSWRSKYAKASKQERAVMESERSLAGKLAAFGKVELNTQRGERESGDTDIYFDGRATQVKQTGSQRVGVLRDLARKGSKQADVVVIAHGGHPNEEEEVKVIKKWKGKHQKKKIYIYNNLLNTFKEI